MLTVGTDSYVTIADSDEYVSVHYRAISSEWQRWTECPEADKEILLRQACGEIESLPLLGRKYVVDQPMAFPRVRYGSFVPPPAVPAEVRGAQIELALWSSDDSAAAEAEQRRSLRDQGVVSFSLGDLSEAYAAGGVQPAAYLCPQARRLLGRWLNGGYAAC